MSEHKQESTAATCGITGADLGDVKAFPREVAPHTADGVRAWTRKALVTETSDIASVGVPPAFQQGVIGGFVDACDELAQQDVADDVLMHVAFFRGLFAAALEGGQ